MLINFANKGKIEVLQELKKYIEEAIFISGKTPSVSTQEIISWVDRKIELIKDIDKRNNKNHENIMKKINSYVKS